MTELAVRDENGSKSSIFILAHVQQFNALALSCQALASQLNVRETYEFYLEAPTPLKPHAPLNLSGGFGGTSALFNLAQQRSAMLSSVLFGNQRAMSATTGAAVRLCFGDALKNEVSMSVRPSLRHWVPPPPSPIPLAWTTYQQHLCAR